MRFSSLFTQGLLAAGVTASKPRGRWFRRQDGPTDPGIPSDCTYWETAFDEDYDCAYFMDSWGLEREQFIEYNPSVKSDCSGIQVGHSYCVEVNFGFPRDEEPPKETATEDNEPEPTEDSKPSPTQDGLIDTCTSFYQAVKGDTCPKIIAKYKTFDFDDFFKWNPAVEDDCSGLWANTWYCVGVPGTPTSPPSQTAATETAVETGPSEPSPTQEGLIESCTTYYFAGKGDTCAKIVAKYGTFDFDDFYKWNPAVHKDCSGIWANTWYCVGIPGTPTTKPSSTTRKPTATGGIQTPSPIQEGIPKNCEKFHLIKSTTTCASIESYYKLPLATFLSWNPAVGKDCGSLWTGYWVCVSVEGYKPSTTTTRATTTTKAPASGIQTPSPIQNGMVKNCEKFHMIKSTTTCTSIQDYYNLPLATFLSWNPAVGKDCTSLLANYWVCVGTVGWKPPTTTTKAPTTTKKPSNGITTPTPIQAGMVTNCNKFHMIKSTTTCASIQDYYGITMADIAKWNPAVGSKCSALLVNYNVCVGVIGGTPTKPGNGIETPSPIQSGMVSNCKKFHLVKSTTTCASIQNYYKITLAQLAKWNPAVGSKCTALWAQYWVCVGV
ncbi:hypothetical protein CEP54_007320 [Fusarium duplospermum]|uniref:LysM domain-containing protein n=1 Tax=Fusarium duplospermum TaxID=1325734 RepID=A0A428Q224_9HYPO|nr:hypothetical protein CEP54_007320 [Fusarium duplospermum]